MLQGAISMTIYLYVKTHNKTGLKYLGKTTAKDPHKYKGSGTYWISHIKKHGYDVTTSIIQECSSSDEIMNWGLFYSNLWDVVKSDEWANLKPELGDGGSVGGNLKKAETKKKISNTMKGRPAHNKGLRQSHKKHQPRKDAGSKRDSNGVSKLKGRIRPRLICPHCKRDIDEANHHRYHGDKCKLK